MSTASKSYPERVDIETVSGVFSKYREELEWLATFLTRDEQIGAACVIDACALAESENPGFQEWLLEWARLATIRSTVQIQQRRITQLSSAYMQHRCIHGGHPALSADSVERLVEESSWIRRRLDVLCRFALVICGLEKRSAQQAASLLGVDRTSVEGAYCTAIKSLEVIGCGQFDRQNESAAMCN
jgi:hypothetical protein